MQLAELKSVLSKHPGQLVRFILPDGEAIPPSFHVTEVGCRSARHSSTVAAKCIPI